MATDLSKRVFISYSRKDMEFVDRLEVGLTARGFVPWVDRSHIEGGDDWQDSIERAIDTCDKFVVILTPDALESEWVKIEYRYGHSMKKRLIPVLLKPCPRVPAILNYRQWVTSFPADFDLGLNDLLVALSREDPQTEKFVDANPTGVDETGDAAPGEEPTMSVLDLDIAGSEAYKKGDLELAAIYWQRLLDIEPDYLSGDVAAKVATIEIQLAPIRAQRLRDKAYEAHRRGEWESEIANWEEFLKIQDDEEARGELANARRNAEKPQRDRYARAKAWTERSENDEARKDLAQLWSQAPFYGDPDGIAPKLGLAPPVTYREKKRLDDEKAAQDAARRAEEKRRADELAAQEAARRAEEARRQSEIAAAEAARRAEEKRLADVAAASAAAIRAEKMRQRMRALQMRRERRGLLARRRQRRRKRQSGKRI